MVIEKLFRALRCQKFPRLSARRLQYDRNGSVFELKSLTSYFTYLNFFVEVCKMDIILTIIFYAYCGD